MKRKVGLALLCGVLAALLCGCGTTVFRSAEDLFAQPKLPERYKDLSETIQTVMREIDAEQAAPLSGSNTSTIQLLDLDGDGVEEAAAAFFRSNSAEDPQPMKIYFFQSGSDGSYEVVWILQGEGNNINSIAYDDLDGNGEKEVVVSWQLTSRANVLTVYTLGLEPEEILRTTYNESYSLADLDRDSLNELLVIQRDDTGEDHSRVSFYTYEDGTLVLSSTANLSENLTDVVAVRSGILSDQTPALYVTSECEGGRVTDIMAYQGHRLVNVTLNPASLVSNETLRSDTDINVIDIDNDGVLEIPVSENMPSVSKDSTTTYWLTHWRNFDSSGDPSMVCTTYHSSDGWYLVIPDEWDGCISVERDDSNSYRGERAVVFYHLEEDEEPVRFMTIYRLTGDNRSAQASRGNRELLQTDSSAAYAVEFIRSGWDCGLDAGQIRERFNFITTEWSSLEST